MVQKKNTIESLEEPYSSEVVDYVFGVFESKGKTKKKREQTSIKSKTTKNTFKSKTKGKINLKNSPIRIKTTTKMRKKRNKTKKQESKISYKES